MHRLLIGVLGILLIATYFTVGAVPARRGEEAGGERGPAAQIEARAAVHGDRSRLAVAAAGDDAASAGEAIARLREAGPEGLTAFLDANRGRLSEPGVRDALDAVAAQKHAYISRLYWYTDLEKAKAAARAEGKPILSLRLLGRLDEELSCANSRYFRVALYANAKISKYLRERFVLHWESVRPAPVFTVDYGDGRKLVRTITGNSIHYVLDPDGRIVDAIPGLWGPEAFLREIRTAGEAAREEWAMEPSLRGQWLAAWHGAQLAALLGERDEAVESEGLGWSEGHGAALAADFGSTPRYVPGRLAVGVAVTKMIVERRAVAEVADAGEANPLGEAGSGLISADELTPEGWSRLAARALPEARLDGRSLDLMRALDVDAIARSAFPVPGTGTPGAWERAVLTFERRMAEDTVRNKYHGRAILHARLAGPDAESPLPQFNRKVYAALFGTPDSDPWLGLVAPDTWSGLPRDGLLLAVDVGADLRRPSRD